MIEIIGAPFDKCGRRPGSALGPVALRHAGLIEALESIGLTVDDGGDISTDALAIDTPGGLRHFGDGFPTYSRLRRRVQQSLDAGRVPLVVGGDHSISIGSVAGALGQFPGELAVLWIDAHADLNVPSTSPSGNLHGMALAALTGQDDPAATPEMAAQWRQILNEIVPKPALGFDRLSWIGLRDVDRGESDAIARHPEAFATTMQDIDRWGSERVLEEFDVWMRSTGARHLWVSFDVDCLDPILAPGTGTAVRGGLTYREGHLVAELLHSWLIKPDCPYRLAGLDLVETNPLEDANNSTAKMAVEWCASLMGKTILNMRSRFER